MTIKTLKEKILVAAQTLEKPDTLAERIIALIPSAPTEFLIPTTIKEALAINPTLKELYDKEIDAKEIIDLVQECDTTKENEAY